MTLKNLHQKIKELREADPATRYIAENVDFRTTHPEDYRTISEQLGEAEYIDAKHTSGAARKRLFWHNLGPATEHPANSPMDANTLLEPGCTLDKGRTTAPCIMAAWQCAHKACRRTHGQCTEPHEHARWHYMSTHNPVVIYQGGQARHIRPEEAERLMGLPTGGETQTKVHEHVAAHREWNTAEPPRSHGHRATERGRRRAHPRPIRIATATRIQVRAAGPQRGTDQIPTAQHGQHAIRGLSQRRNPEDGAHPLGSRTRHRKEDKRRAQTHGTGMDGQSRHQASIQDHAG